MDYGDTLLYEDIVLSPTHEKREGMYTFSGSDVNFEWDKAADMPDRIRDFDFSWQNITEDGDGSFGATGGAYSPTASCGTFEGSTDGFSIDTVASNGNYDCINSSSTTSSASTLNGTPNNIKLEYDDIFGDLCGDVDLVSTPANAANASNSNPNINLFSSPLVVSPLTDAAWAPSAAPLKSTTKKNTTTNNNKKQQHWSSSKLAVTGKKKVSLKSTNASSSSATSNKRKSQLLSKLNKHAKPSNGNHAPQKPRVEATPNKRTANGAAAKSKKASKKKPEGSGLMTAPLMGNTPAPMSDAKRPASSLHQPATSTHPNNRGPISSSSLNSSVAQRLSAAGNLVRGRETLLSASGDPANGPQQLAADSGVTVLNRPPVATTAPVPLRTSRTANPNRAPIGKRKLAQQYSSSHAPQTPQLKKFQPSTSTGSSNTGPHARGLNKPQFSPMVATSTSSATATWQPAQVAASVVAGMQNSTSATPLLTSSQKKIKTMCAGDVCAKLSSAQVAPKRLKATGSSTSHRGGNMAAHRGGNMAAHRGGNLAAHRGGNMASQYQGHHHQQSQRAGEGGRGAEQLARSRKTSGPVATTASRLKVAPVSNVDPVSDPTYLTPNVGTQSAQTAKKNLESLQQYNVTPTQSKVAVLKKPLSPSNSFQVARALDTYSSWNNCGGTTTTPGGSSAENQQPTGCEPSSQQLQAKKRLGATHPKAAKSGDVLPIKNSESSNYLKRPNINRQGDYTKAHRKMSSSKFAQAILAQEKEFQVSCWGTGMYAEVNKLGLLRKTGKIQCNCGCDGLYTATQFLNHAQNKSKRPWRSIFSSQDGRPLGLWREDILKNENMM